MSHNRSDFLARSDLFDLFKDPQLVSGQDGGSALTDLES
jgi:hypothetical protein